MGVPEFMDFSRTSVSWRRPITSYAKVRVLIAACLRNRRFQSATHRLRGKTYVDLGCGPNTRPGFINIDYQWNPGLDICWDLTRGIPLQDATVKGVFTEHCLEHFPLEGVEDILCECWRVLTPGGTIRIVVPDGELYLTRYVDKKRGQAAAPLPYAESDVYEGLYSPIMSVNRIFNGSGHQFIFDFDSLALLLARTGFVNITNERFRSGRDAQLLQDSESRAIESMYVEASKPV